jgi:glycine/D-amino acid oxidase-like deaminating enzyme/nitrite reductase/ring-hydroxylating ferredoxin subunit
MGMTARTTAHLSAISDDSFDSFIKLRGLEAAKQFHESHAAAIARIETIQAREAIACDFRRLPGYLFPAAPEDASGLDKEREAGRKVGVTVADKRGLPLKNGGETRCLRYDHQAAFHPMLYLRGLAEQIEKRNGRFYGHTAVNEVEEHDGVVLVKTAGGFEVRARAAVVATNSPINERVAMHSKEAPYRTYAMAFSLPKGAIEDALYWDTAEPYHYVRLQPGEETDYLIVGGEDHKSGEADDAPARFDALEAWPRKLVPALGKETHRWSGQVLEPIDYAAFIGRNPDSQNVYVATGDSGQGITHGVVASLIISSLILHGRASWTELYEPSRITPSAAGKFISENLTTLKNLAEYVAPGELSTVDELQPGQGAIIRQGLKKIAAYRDDNGTLYQRSAACTHLGCHLQWNSLERCWDCPCHGSHFAVDGAVLNGPAIFPLSEV